MAVASILALVLIGGWSVWQFNDSAPGLPSGNIQVYAMESTEGSTGGHIGADPEESDGVVVAWNLDPNQQHHVWCINRQGERIRVAELRVGESGSVMQSLTFPEAIGGYDHIYVARDDGTEELSVKPNQGTTEPFPTDEPTAAD